MTGRMRSPNVVTAALLLLIAGCRQAPAGPSPTGSVQALIERLTADGLRVTVSDRIPSEVNGFFSPMAQQLLVNDARISAFEYPTAAAAAAEAAQVRDEQPNPMARITWVSRPHFYRQDSLMVVYVGCQQQIVDALGRILGPPFAVGTTPCAR